jgi:hypothetical protein
MNPYCGDQSLEDDDSGEPVETDFEPIDCCMGDNPDLSPYDDD